jgi:predicted nuclease of predicted toxin-antitoxin system
MKLLLDQNISHRILPKILPHFPDSKHVRDFGMSSADDTTIWNLAAEKNLTIVSKDSDFLYRSLLSDGCPKVIQLQVGNCSSEQIRELLLRNTKIIEQFISDPNESLLILR